MMQCAECKGKGKCGLPRCPIVSRFQVQAPVRPSASYQGTAPSVFVGSFGYPDVSGGPLLVNDSDNPPDWLRRGLGIDDIVAIRAKTIRGSAGLAGISGDLQEIAISSRPLDVDVLFAKPVSFSLSFDGTVAPVGFSGPVRTLDVIGSASVGRAVDRITSDTDLPATEAAVALMESDIDVYQIQKLMTAGLLGKRRMFVPTRWAITAVDDTLSKNLRREIARYPPVGEVLVFSAEIYGNRIVCMLVPGDYRFEMVEIWGRQSLWAGDDEVIVQDREGMTKSGYSPIAGAYYSARLAVCEHLSRIRRSARIIVVRSVSGQYWAPLGTWVIREAARKAMASPPVACASLEEGVQQVTAALGSDTWLKKSTLVPEMRAQRTLFSFADSRES